jgi:hypothetical protein
MRLIIDDHKKKSPAAREATAGPARARLVRRNWRAGGVRFAVRVRTQSGLSGVCVHQYWRSASVAMDRPGAGRCPKPLNLEAAVLLHPTAMPQRFYSVPQATPSMQQSARKKGHTTSRDSTSIASLSQFWDMRSDLRNCTECRLEDRPAVALVSGSPRAGLVFQA